MIHCPCEEVAEWSNAIGCKPVHSLFVGSNPTLLRMMESSSILIYNKTIHNQFGGRMDMGMGRDDASTKQSNEQSYLFQMDASSGNGLSVLNAAKGAAKNSSGDVIKPARRSQVQREKMKMAVDGLISSRQKKDAEDCSMTLVFFGRPSRSQRRMGAWTFSVTTKSSLKRLGLDTPVEKGRNGVITLAVRDGGRSGMEDDFRLNELQSVNQYFQAAQLLGRYVYNQWCPDPRWQMLTKRRRDDVGLKVSSRSSRVMGLTSQTSSLISLLYMGAVAQTSE